MLNIRTLLFYVIIFLFINEVSAQEKYPATFLWKISGNGLAMPSYLYGTMHVQDKRLFYFGDSVYSAIDKTNGFAMEIDPSEMMDSLFKELERKDTSTLIKKILNEKEYKRVAKQLEKKFNIPADKITTKKMAALKRQVSDKAKRKDDMPTFMDLYLFNIAENKGKVTGGIEDVADQFHLADEIGLTNIDEYLNDDTTQFLNYMDRLKKIYINKDLTGINNLTNDTYTNSFKDILLIKRNAKMAVRMDSLSHIRNSFFAVGAAHLPGDSGVISLLRKKGFIVEPVFSDKNISPDEYKYVIQEKPWIKVADDKNVCTVKMPGVPSQMTIDQVLPMKMYVNLAEITYYALGVTFVTQAEAVPDSIFGRIIDNYKRTGLEIISKKKIEYNGAPGIEMIALQGNENYFRYRILLNGNKVVLVIFGAQKVETLDSDNAIKYFNSLVFNNEDKPIKEWEIFTDEKNAFSVRFPSKPVFTSAPEQGSSTYIDKYIAGDITDGSYYFLMVTDTEPGFYIESDSLYFDEYKKNLNITTDSGVKEFSQLMVKGFPACYFNAIQKSQGTEFVLKGYLMRRGNRTYTQFAVTSKETADFPQVTNFFRSFQALPYKNTTWRKSFLPDSSVSTKVPSDFILAVKDSSSYLFNSRVNKYVANNKNNATNYSIEIENISPYYWASNDSVYFKDKANSFAKYNDSIISYTYKNGLDKQADVLIKLGDVKLYKKLRILLNGDKVYTLFSYLSQDILDEKNSNTFFDEATFAKKIPSTIFNSKSKLLLDALKSNDSAAVTDASDQLYEVHFDKNDIPLLLNALTNKYKKSLDEYTTTNKRIANKIAEITDSTVISFVQKNYTASNDSIKELPVIFLSLLADNKTQPSYSLLKDLLIKAPPSGGTIYYLINSLYDSLVLASALFPDVTKLYGDSIAGAGMLHVAANLLDSNYVKEPDIIYNEEGVMLQAKIILKALANDKDAYPSYTNDVLRVLAMFNSKEGNALLTKFAVLPQLWVKNSAIPLLLKNGQVVMPASIKQLAANKEWRMGLYDALKKINKQQFFPKDFYTQQRFAESYIYDELMQDDEIEINKIDFVAEKTAIVKGITKRFILSKIKFNSEEGDASYHLTICGPFNIDRAIAEIDDTVRNSKVFYDDPFLQSAINIKFAEYIQELNK